MVYIYQRGELARRLLLFLPPLYLIKKCYSEEKLVAGLSQELKGIKNAFRWLLESTMISKFRGTNQNKLNGPAIQVDYRSKYKAEFRTIVVYLQRHL